MKNDCSIVRDLLPLYIESIVHEDTAEFIRQHLAGCAECSREFRDMSAPDTPIAKSEAAPLKSIKRALRRKKMQAMALSVIVVLALAVSLFAFLTAPSYFPYDPQLLTVTENADGSINVVFDESVTGYSLQKSESPDAEYASYSIEAWTCKWDSFFQARGAQNAIIKPRDGEAFLLYYVQNCSPEGHDAEDVLLYGNTSPLCNGRTSLPRLSPGYLLILSAAAFLLLGIGWIFFRKNPKIRLRIERLLPLPVSYAIGHLCVLGFSFVSYSMQRDFALITALGIIFSCAFLLLLDLGTAKKEIRRTVDRG